MIASNKYFLLFYFTLELKIIIKNLISGFFLSLFLTKLAIFE